MFLLHDLRKSRVWQEAYNEGFREGLEEAREEGRLSFLREVIERQQANGRTLKEIAELLILPLAKVRRLARRRQAPKKSACGRPLREAVRS